MSSAIATAPLPEEFRAFKVSEVAELFSCHVDMVKKLCAENRLPVIYLSSSRSPRSMRIPAKSVSDYLASTDAMPLPVNEFINRVRG